MDAVEVRALTSAEWPAAAAIAARAMRSNPGFKWMVGEDELVVASTLYDLMAAPATDAVTVGAWHGRLLVACARMSRDGRCLGATAAAFGAPPPFDGDEPPREHRALHSMHSIAVHEPDWPHWHLGPIAVEPGFQGRGLGHQVMTPLLDRLDTEHIAGWLETDKPENVRFYEAHGFEVADRVELFGVESWYLSRSSPS